MGRAPLFVLTVALLAACGEREQTPEPDPVAQALAELRRFEGERRAATRFDEHPAGDRVLGADPYDLAPAGEGFVAIERGNSRVLLLDGEARQLAAAKAPRETTGLSVVGDEVWVTGRAERVVARYRLDGDQLSEVGRYPIPAAVMPRDVVASERVIYVVDELADQLHYSLRDEDGEPETWWSQPLCRAPFGLELVGRRLVARCLVDHRVVVRWIDREGLPLDNDAEINHDGPIWSSLSWEQGGSLWVALGGVEDHPLVRTEGYFGHIDSFLYLYLLGGPGQPRQVATLNLSALGVITPKALARDGEELVVTGYGGERAVRLRIEGATMRVTASTTWPPGTNAVVVRDGEVWTANPLLDGWGIGWDRPRLVPVKGPRDVPDAADVRLGEVMVFTGLMAPYNATEGAHSRFACETCHFEGGIDGRVHHTGRGKVHASTKPLFGLFNNKPHFTRALDKDLTQVSHAEFRVAGAGSGHSPWFHLDVASRPWLAELLGSSDRLTPERLRRGVLSFLMAHSHRPNPRRQGQSAFTEAEGRGAALFRDRCVSCHAARLSTDEPGSEQPFAQWESLVLSEQGPLVWASAEYREVGVKPHVHEKGARTSSLRRIEHKRPYFTNGSAASLDEVLAEACWTKDRFFHAAGPEGCERFETTAREDLLAFLRLL